MNNLYDILNITGNKEEKIKSCISNVRLELEDLIEDQTCMIYSSYISEELYKNHIINRIIRTGEVSSYDHHFVLVPKDGDSYYLRDLTYSQFNNYDYNQAQKEEFKNHVLDIINGNAKNRKRSNSRI